MRLIRHCKRGKIDLIITKSVSRFARNTKDAIEYVRLLKTLNVGVLFEKEGINTLEESEGHDSLSKSKGGTRGELVPPVRLVPFLARKGNKP